MPVSTKQPGSVLTRSAEEVKRYRLYKKIVPPVLGLITLVLIIVYIISILFTKYGSFTVKINNLTDRKYYLTLCESDKFLNPVSYLNSKAVKDVTNIDGNSLPADLNDVDGEHNGENYVAYTFYAKNVGQSTITYDYDLVISRKTIGVDSAIRVRLYYTPFYYDSFTKEYTRSGDYTDYAKPRTGGSGLPEVDPDNRTMTNFAASGSVAQGRVAGFKPGDISKITVVIWIEGNDPECTDDILGGEFKVDMVMNVVAEE